VSEDPVQPDRAVDAFGDWIAAARSFVGDRLDLVDRIDAAAARAARTSTVVAVVGEFKQGKSALVNSVLADSVCPVDDHAATAAVTIVRHGDEPSVTVHRRDADGRLTAETVDPATRSAHITEPVTIGVDDDPVSVERVDIAVPNALLATGLVLVDTPGVGGIKRSHADATMAFLRHADALVFVSDATSELTEPEVAFLRDAVTECPMTVVALTKTDLFSQWRRIAELDAGHLARAGIDAEIFPLSFPVRVEAMRRRDPDLDSESGYPALARFLTHSVVPTVRAGAAARAASEAARIVDAVAESDRVELAALDEPAADAATRLAELCDAQDRLAALAAGNARWRTVLNDQVTDLTHDVTHGFRDDIRRALDELDTDVDTADGADELDAAGDALRVSVIDAVSRAFARVDDGVEAVTDRVAAALGVDQLDVGTPAEIAAAARIAAGGWVDHDAEAERGGAGQAFSFLRGAQGGVLMLALVGGLLPAAAASVVVATPFLVGAGLLFGGKQLADARTQRRQRARQRVKATMRKSVDDVQFRVGGTLAEALRVAHRYLRDELGARIDELHRTTAERVHRLERAASADAGGREARRRDLTARVEQALVLAEEASTFAQGVRS
jgi:hypothetical protein